MKIAIPVNENNKMTDISMSFGRAPYFLIVDTVSTESFFLSNAAAASEGGAGIKAAQLVVDSRAEALLTPRCGKNAAEILEAAEVKIYKTETFSAESNIEAFQRNQLSTLEEIHAGFHHHGNKHENSSIKR
ncbi:NifB/NifX family molybdenum-iron cluster-binding protein [Aminipila sp.]|uniref:NifB/NifX family molybdenum-iron cluster-binding protein n=1 Tax=Aminipila sp. TaxID=2060095 RepID=UPI00289AB60C|nr:NifB/NifX family molybdenum-iron cluster-binding protein [Aminipila sp.]